MRVALDCRMRYGVGRILRNIVPIVAPELEEVILLGEKEHLVGWAAEVPNVRVVDFESRMYSVREQLRFPYGVRHRVDLLHVPNYNIPLFWPARMVVTINDLAHLSTAMPTNSLQRAYAHFFVREASRRACHLITLSEFSRRELAEKFGVARERITVAHCAVDGRVFRPAGDRERGQIAHLVSPEAPYILVAGSLRPHKNLNTVLLAFQELIRRHRVPHRLVVAGEGEGFRVNERRVTVCPETAKRVVFAGFVPDQLLAALYGHCAVFVFPSLYEGFGLPPLEAMACGAPVVVSNRASLPELVGDAAVLVDPLDVGAMAGELFRVISSPALQGELRQRGIQRAASFSWQATAKTYLDVYRQCLMEKGR